MPRSARKFSCKVWSPRHTPAHLTSQGLLAYCFFFSVQPARDPPSPQVRQPGTAAPAKTLDSCHFWQTELSPDSNSDSYTKFERKVKPPKKSSQNKPLKQGRGHNSHSDTQREVGVLPPFLPSDCTILSRFPFFCRKGCPRQDRERTPDATWSYLEQAHFPRQHAAITSKTLNPAFLDTQGPAQNILFYIFGDYNASPSQAQLLLATGHCMFCLTPSTQKPENSPWNIKTL